MTMQVLKLTDVDGSKVIVFPERILCIRDFPNYTEIVYSKEHQIRVKESADEILNMRTALK